MASACRGYILKGRIQRPDVGKLWSPAEQEVVTETFRLSALKVNGKEVWAKPDEPLNIRVPKSVLFGIKKLMVMWGFDKQGLRVEVSAGT